MTTRTLLELACSKLGRAIEVSDVSPLEALGLLALAQADLEASAERLRVAAAAQLGAESPDGG